MDWYHTPAVLLRVDHGEKEGPTGQQEQQEELEPTLQGGWRGPVLRKHIGSVIPNNDGNDHVHLQTRIELFGGDKSRMRGISVVSRRGPSVHRRSRRENA